MAVTVTLMALMRLINNNNIDNNNTDNNNKLLES